ncbi:hypothetical protein CJ030_MR3G007311 [Morella rubra]|uniref:Uncharacterized protein n=1 Tax=Morella rubra TaxID=262757 RepID=A0A6A1W0R7_9ROSI|nr:hypothetical protein CJ030_MR3G007311 [Morella rubra]
MTWQAGMWETSGMGTWQKGDQMLLTWKFKTWQKLIGVLTNHCRLESTTSGFQKTLLVQPYLWDAIETTTEPPNPEDVVEFKAWRKKNAAALHAIQLSCLVNIQAQIGEDDTAKIVWDAFAESFDPKAQGNRGMHHEVFSNGSFVYYFFFLVIVLRMINYGILSCLCESYDICPFDMIIDYDIMLEI